MEIEKINNFLHLIKGRDLQSFENDLLQLWGLMSKNKRILDVCTLLEEKYSEINSRVIEFYNRVNESFNKREYIQKTKELLSENDDSYVALGYFLYREELKLKIIGFHRVMMYWYPEYNQETPYDSKKTFTRKILVPFVEYMDKNITSNFY